MNEPVQTLEENGLAVGEAQAKRYAQLCSAAKVLGPEFRIVNVGHYAITHMTPEAEFVLRDDSLFLALLDELTERKFCVQVNVDPQGEGPHPVYVYIGTTRDPEGVPYTHGKAERIGEGKTRLEAMLNAVDAVCGVNAA